MPYDMERAPLKRPFGPSGVLTTERFLKTSGLSLAAVRYALIGLQTIEPLPEAMNRLFELSSQLRTSSVIVLSKNSLPQRKTSTISFFLKAIFPSLSNMCAPNDHMIGRRSSLASGVCA